MNIFDSTVNKEIVYLEDAESKIDELDKLSRDYPDLYKNIKTVIDNTRNQYKKQIKEHNDNQIKYAQEERRVLNDFNQKCISNLVKYFLKVESSKSLPGWAKDYDIDIIHKAIIKYRDIQRDITDKEKKWNNIKQFVISNQGYPINYSKLSNEDKVLYEKAIKMLNKGILQPKLIEIGNISEQYQKLIKRTFYHSDELTPEEREELCSKYGYRHKPFIFRNGSSGNNLIIKNSGKSESDYHFCMKHLFAEIETAHSKVEYQIGDKRADVVFIYAKNKIAIEIETGANKEIQVKNKVDWLNQYFDFWIIVCSRANKKFYKKYVDNNKSFCLTLKDADEKIQELITQY